MTDSNSHRIAWNNEKTLRRRFSFLCNAAKGDFSPTEESGVHFCSQCQKKVYEVDTEEAFNLHARQQNCVVVKTHSNIDLVAKPHLYREIFLTLAEDFGGTRFGPFAWNSENKIKFGSDFRAAHIHIPKGFGLPDIFMWIEFSDTSLLLRKLGQGDLQVLSAGSEQRKSVTSTEIIGDGDQIFVKGNESWIGFTVAVVEREPIKLGGQVQPLPEPKKPSSFGSLVAKSFSYVKRLFTKE